MMVRHPTAQHHCETKGEQIPGGEGVRGAERSTDPNSAVTQEQEAQNNELQLGTGEYLTQPSALPARAQHQGAGETKNCCLQQ